MKKHYASYEFKEEEDDYWYEEEELDTGALPDDPTTVIARCRSEFYPRHKVEATKVFGGWLISRDTWSCGYHEIGCATSQVFVPDPDHNNCIYDFVLGLRIVSVLKYT